ncbi:MAG: chemotaxis protein CheX [Deltaproteobacteria bacterium]|nr:chemotaxis protein CheX [Deltaproteobacteria bacterium]
MGVPSADQLRELLMGAVSEALGGLYSMPITWDPALEFDSSSQGGLIAGRVELLGDLAGALTVVVSEKLASACVEIMLGEPAQDPGQVNDAVGELGNVVAGSLLTKLSELVSNLDLGVPEVEPMGATSNFADVDNSIWVKCRVRTGLGVYPLFVNLTYNLPIQREGGDAP